MVDFVVLVESISVFGINTEVAHRGEGEEGRGNEGQK